MRPRGIWTFLPNAAIALVIAMTGASCDRERVSATDSSTDNVAPSVVTDLLATQPDLHSIRISWTAPGDDGLVGTASSYDIRYATSQAVLDAWTDAFQVSNEPTPSIAGTPESHVVSRLGSGATYFLSIRTQDEAGNVSPSATPSISFMTLTEPIPTPTGFSRVPSGQFVMGDGGSECGVDERTVVLTEDFFLGQTEVTNLEYATSLQWALDQGHVTVDSGWVVDALDGSTQKLADVADANSDIAFDGTSFSVAADRDDHPVHFVTWYGAVAFCDWQSLRAGLPRAYDHATWRANGGALYAATGFRLPTDAEWEYAAQFSDNRIYPWGNDAPSCSDANFNPGTACNDWIVAVKSFPAAPAGLNLFDMAGNLYEWCHDTFQCDLGTSTETDPAVWSTQDFRVARGGGQGSPAARLRNAERIAQGPSLAFSSYGFRVARTVDP